MQTVEMNATSDPMYELSDQLHAQDTASGFLRSPRSRQKSRFGQKNSSVPSITLSEPELHDDKLGMLTLARYSSVTDIASARPYRYVLAELPGSTPDDLHRPSSDLHEGFDKSQSKSMEEVLQAGSSRHKYFHLKGDVEQKGHVATIAASAVSAAAQQHTAYQPTTRRSIDSIQPTLSFFDNRARAS